MAFISNAENFSLGDGVYNNVHGSIIHNYHFYGPKRGREEIEDEAGVLPPLIERAHKRRRLEGAVEWEPEAVEMASIGLEIIDHEDLGLIHQIGRGPGYLLHAGRNKKKNRAVTVKVFNNAPTTRPQLELEATLFKGLMHPNIPRLEGISTSTSMPQFIAYEEFRWKQAKGPLASALQSRVRSIELGFKMVADLSAGLSYLSMQQLRMAAMKVENFDVFLDVNDRFLILINPNPLDGNNVPDAQAPQEDGSWALFNGLCRQLLVSANRMLHNEGIDRTPALLPPTPTLTSSKTDSPASSIGTASSRDEPEDAPSTVDPRREYVWRAMDRGDQSLATITDEMSANLSTALARLHTLTQTDGRSPHRCAGYLREEITLAPTVVNSAVIAHNTPSPLEICSVCREVVGFQEKFHCVCAASDPGLHPTIKCKVCRVWSHSQCVGNPKSDFTCRLCDGPEMLEWRPSDAPPIWSSSDNPSAPALSLSHHESSSPSIPSFEVMPPMSKIASLAGSGCTCGLECACPGCVEHRGPEHLAKDRPSCADGRGTCVDAHAGIALRVPAYETPPSSFSTIIDQFFARAAALPAPPSNRKMGFGADFDPMNVIVYPSAAMENQQRGRPFGLVSLPKLEL